MGEYLSKVTVLGLGKMGQAAVPVWNGRAKLVTCADSDLSKAALAQGLGVSFVHLPNSYSREDLVKLAQVTDIWHIATPAPLHAYHLLAGLQGSKKIFVEKPSTQRLEDAKAIIGSGHVQPIQVDYLERANPAVLALRDKMVKDGFMPSHFFHWRSRNVVRESFQAGKLRVPDEYKRYALRDLVHDISEIDLLLNATLGYGVERGVVTDSAMKSWAEAYWSKYPWEGDVSAKFSIGFPNNVSADIKGQADFDFQRSFVVVDQAWEQAYFAQTITREDLRLYPFAAKISGRTSVQRLLEETKTGKVWRTADFRWALEGENVEFLDLFRYNQNPLAVMIENLDKSKQEAELICPLRKAIQIEELAASAYQVANCADFLAF